MESASLTTSLFPWLNSSSNVNCMIVVVYREIKCELRRYKFHIDDWDFIIAHRKQVIMLKQIVDHNVETGETVCRSINNFEYPYFTLNLREVAFLY
jgi:hypothetical protein